MCGGTKGNISLPEASRFTFSAVASFVMRECIHPYRNYNILALRGKLSQGVVSAVLQESLGSVVLGDPGLLMNRILDDRPSKKTKVGIIPHYVDRNNPLVDRLLKGIPGSRLIDITNDPFSTLGEIASCETVVSSALHGLIASDSFGIPNRWVKFSDALMGDDFKFDDYYSVFDMKIAPIDMRTSDQTISDRWIRTLRVPESAVQEVCSKLIMASRQCWPKTRPQLTTEPLKRKWIHPVEPQVIHPRSKFVS